MKYKNANLMNFSTEISHRAIMTEEFFSNVMLDCLVRNFGFKKVVISYFNIDGKFLSWINSNGLSINTEEHPYRNFANYDIVRRIVYKDSTKDKLTYNNVTPRLYRSTDIIKSCDYDNCKYVQFIEEVFNSHYSVTMPFGTNGYVQITFFKSFSEGDFIDEEIELLNRIYTYMANGYKNFKTHEKIKIISNIQSEIISLGEKAYLITDNFMNIISYNDFAQDYLIDLIGPSIIDQLDMPISCNWIPFLIGNEESSLKIRIIKNYIFKIYTYDKIYSHGIIDRYYWIIISKKETEKDINYCGRKVVLTQTEQIVAKYMYNGLTYKAIADELVVSYHTIKKHVQNIYSKCGVKNRFQLCKWIDNNKI